MEGFTVRVTPGNVDLEVNPGETVMDAAERLGWRWPTVCHGDAECGVCWMDVQEGADSLSPRTGEEDTALETVPLDRDPKRTIRLACRAQVLGDGLVVGKKGVVRSEAAAASRPNS